MERNKKIGSKVAKMSVDEKLDRSIWRNANGLMVDAAESRAVVERGARVGRREIGTK